MLLTNPRELQLLLVKLKRQKSNYKVTQERILTNMSQEARNGQMAWALMVKENLLLEQSHKKKSMPATM